MKQVNPVVTEKSQFESRHKPFFLIALFGKLDHQVSDATIKENVFQTESRSTQCVAFH